MALLYVLALGGVFASGFLTCLLWVTIRDERRGREIEQLVRDAADADTEHGLGM